MKPLFGSRNRTSARARNANRRTAARAVKRARSYRPSLQALENRRVLAGNLAFVQGTIFDDVDGDNTVDVGEGLAGVQVRLETSTGQPVLLNNVQRTAVTDNTGTYTFNELVEGDYVVRQPAQSLGARQLSNQATGVIAVTADDADGELRVPIDTFENSANNANPHAVVDITSNDGPAFEQRNTADAIGGQRDLVVDLTSADGSISFIVDDPTGFRDAISFDTGGAGDGERRVIWDGIDADPITVDDTGGTNNLLADLTDGGAATGFNFTMGADQGGREALLRVYTNDGNAATQGRFTQWTVMIPQFANGTTDAQNEFVEFVPDAQSTTSRTDFGGGADLTQVSAIELEIIGGLTIDGKAELIGAFGPTQRLASNIDNFEEADLGVTKTVNDASPNVGDNVTYTVTVTNNGPDIATNVDVTDQLPAGVSFVSASAGNNYNSNTGVWNVGTVGVGAGSTQTLTLVGRVDAPATSSTATNFAFTNTASVTDSDQSDSVTGNNQRSVTVTPNVVDLEVSKTASNSTPNVGETVRFDIVVNNTLPTNANNVRIQDILPTGLRIAQPGDVTTSQGTYNSTTGIWDIGTVDGSGSESLTIFAIVDTASVRFNEAQVISVTEHDRDSTPNDGIGDDFSSVQLTTPTANLRLNKSVNDTTPNLDSDVNFTITVTNDGPDGATGVTVLDPLPQNMSFRSASAGQDYNPATGIWNIGSLGNGGSTTLVIVASVDTIGQKTNVAQIQTSNVNDPNSTPGNNVLQEDDQDSVLINPVAVDLSLTKSVNNLSPDIGDNVTFSITVTNSGPSSATGVQVRDQLPTGTQFVSASYAPGSGRTGTPSYDTNTGIWDVGNVNVGTPVTLNLTALVTQVGLTTNSAEIIAADQPDTDSTPNNNNPGEDDQDDAQIRPKEIDLALTKTVNSFSPSLGDEIEFVITVNNTGDDVATGVRVSEQLPGGVTFLSATPSRGSFNRTSGIWTVGTVGVNDPVTLTIRTRVDTIGMGNNSAQVIDADQQDTDSTPNNNVPTEDDQASVGFTTESADLNLVKTVVGDLRPNVGDTVSFDIVVSNSGPDNATGVQVTDLLPSGLRFVSDGVSTGIYNELSGVWTIGDLAAPTERQILEIGPNVNTATSGTLNYSQSGSPATYVSQVASFQADPVAETANALVALGYVPSQFQLRQISRPNNSGGVNVEIRFLGDAFNGIEVPRISVTGNLNNAVNTQTVEESAVGAESTATLRINAIVETTDDIVNIAEITATNQTDPDSTPANGQVNEDDRGTATLQPQSIDLSLTKSASTDKPNPGQEVTFTLAVSNTGEDPATGVEVTDQLPAGLTFVRSLPDGDYNAASGVWTVGDVGVDATKSLEIVALASSNVAETNEAEITAADQRDIDSTPGNSVAGEDDIADATVTPATADLSVTKTVDDNSPNVGEDVVFTIVVNNDGPDQATNVSVRDQIPSGMTITNTSVSTGSFDESNGLWTIPSIDSQRNATLRVTASVDTVADKTNVAQVIASDQFDPDSTPANDIAGEDDQDSALLTPELVDLAITKSIDDNNPNIGDVVLFEIGLTNEGPSPATGVTVLDQLPDGLVFQTSRPSVGAYDPNTGVWNVGSVALGATPTLEIEAIVQAISSAENFAEVRSADQPDSDSTPNNQVDGEDDRASVTLTTQVADLSITKTVIDDTPGRSDEVEFIVQLSNEGPNAATEVVVNDLLPPGLRFVRSTESSGAYDAVTGNWTVPRVEEGVPQQLRIFAAVTSADVSTNTAEITQSRQIDPDSTPDNQVANEDDIASAAVTPRVIDVAVVGEIDNDEPQEGETVQIAFTASNQGRNDATGLEFDVQLPMGLTLASSQPQTGTYNSSTGRWTVGDLASGEVTRLVLNATVAQRGIRTVPIQLVNANEFDVDSTPANDVEIEDDQTNVLVRAPRLLTKRLFLSRS